jgi:hypothetical protein
MYCMKMAPLNTDSIPEVTSTSEPNIATPVPDDQFRTIAEQDDNNSKLIGILNKHCKCRTDS